MQRLSFSHEAAELLRHDLTPNVDLRFAPYISRALEHQKNRPDKGSGVWDSVIDQGEYGLLPFENSSPDSGVVWDHMALLRQRKVEILGEVNLSVRMHAAGIPGAKLGEAKHVYSHVQALKQCSELLNGIAGIQRHETSSTAAGVAEVRRLGSPDAIALASRLAIEDHGLQILAEDVANLKGDENITQFFVIRRGGETALPQPEKQFHAALVRIPERIGALRDLLGVIKHANVSLTSLHSRIDPDHNDEYGFFMEMESSGNAEEFSLLAEQLEAYDVVTALDWIGSWDDRVFSVMEPNDYRSSHGPNVGGTMLDTHKRFHTVLLQPENYRGVLYDILTIIASARVTLTSLQSHTLGRKRYNFTMTMDAAESNVRKMELLTRQLALSQTLRSVEWQGSSDDAPVAP